MPTGPWRTQPPLLDTSAEEAPEGCGLFSTNPPAGEPSTEHDRCEMDPPTRSSKAKQRLVFKRNSKLKKKNSQNYFFSPENLPESKIIIILSNFLRKQNIPLMEEACRLPTGSGGVGGQGEQRGQGSGFGVPARAGCAWSPVRGEGGGLQGCREHNMHSGRGQGAGGGGRGAGAGGGGQGGVCRSCDHMPSAEQ